MLATFADDVCVTYRSCCAHDSADDIKYFASTFAKRWNSGINGDKCVLHAEKENTTGCAHRWHLCPPVQSSQISWCNLGSETKLLEASERVYVQQCQSTGLLIREVNCHLLEEWQTNYSGNMEVCCQIGAWLATAKFIAFRLPKTKSPGWLPAANGT